jgi:hypothetical protein
MSGPRDLAVSLLQNGPAQVGGMVTSVILVGQAFAQFNQTMAPYVAFLFCCLLAVYQVWLVQKATARQCVVIVPIAALILFALALGSNNSLAPAADSTLKNELAAVKEQLQFRDRELENARQLISQLRQNLDLPEKPRHSRLTADQQITPARLLPPRRIVSGLAGFLIGEARAQPSPEEEEKQKALEAWRAYEQKQQELQQEEKRLREKQKQLQQQEEQQKQQPALWRKW